MCGGCSGGFPGLVGGSGVTGCSSQGKDLENQVLQPRTQRLTYLGVAWAKDPVVTDVVEDGSWCVLEVALGLSGLVGGVE